MDNKRPSELWMSQVRQQTKQGFNSYNRLFGEIYKPSNGHDYSAEILTCTIVSRDAPVTDSLIRVVVVAPCIPLNIKHKEI